MNVSFSGTGGYCSFYKNEKEVSFILKSLDGSYSSSVITGVTLPIVRRNFKRATLDPKEYPHLKDINDFTEDYTVLPEYQSVDSLLGLPYEPRIGVVSKIFGPTLNFPLAITTKLVVA